MSYDIAFKTISKFTKNLSKDEKLTILNVFNKTFGCNHSLVEFEWKYEKNPFGCSLHLLTYNENQLIATRTFWNFGLNDSYQCVDTAVLPEYQGRGIFKHQIDYIDKNFPEIALYNYPNSLSIKQYLKYNWVKYHKNNVTVNFDFVMRRAIKESTLQLHELNWRFVLNPNRKYFKKYIQGYYYIYSMKKGFYYLLTKTKHNLSLKECNPIICFSYDSLFGLPTHITVDFISRNCKFNHHSYFFDML